MNPCQKCGESERYENGDCAPCARRRASEYQRQRPEVHEAAACRYRLKNPEKCQAASARWKETHVPNLDLGKRRARGRKYARLSNGWAPGEHEKAEARFPTVTACDCCGSPDPRRKSGFIGDHDHQTGLYRGHLCQPCNLIVGCIDDGHYRREHYPMQAVYLAC